MLYARCLSLRCDDYCRISPITVECSCQREGQPFGFKLEIVDFPEEVSNQVIVFVLLNAAGAVADFSVRF